MSSEPFEVEVAYANLATQHSVFVKVPSGVSLRGAIERSRIVELFPEIDLTKNRVGVYGRLRDLNDLVSAGDRVEIYQPLLVDPKQARRARSNKSNR
ncbi:MAG: RnfH family protein [Gammaproteobacteria bacterium]